jgi:predicted Zn finger-like uncharacterized protein
MAFAVTCKSCNARFLLNDDLLRRKVAGRIVTVRCRQCHASISVDASDLDPTTLPHNDKPEPPPVVARPKPTPPRPPAKSTLMGIGAQRPAGATELVALSPGLLSLSDKVGEGFPEPPPPPGRIEVFDPGDWDVDSTRPGNIEPEPESIDDFVEELPPSLPPVPESHSPSSSGVPSLRTLTHSDASATPRRDDFLANMSAANNGGLGFGAPTIDVSGLGGPTHDPSASSVHVGDGAQRRSRGGQTLPLFDLREELESASARLDVAEPQPLSQAQEPSSRSGAAQRERRNVVAPVSQSVAPERRRSRFAVPLVLALAGAAGFLIWKRSATPSAEPAAAAADTRATAQDPATLPAPPAATVAAENVETTAPVVPSAEILAPPEPRATKVASGIAKQPSGAEGASNRAADSAPARANDAVAATKAPAPERPSDTAEPVQDLDAEPAGPFDKAAAAAALNATIGQASACRKDGDPSGVASAVITFAPSGRVTSASVSGPPFAGTATGGCIAAALRRTKVPPFSGDRVTVSKTIVIQ